MTRRPSRIVVAQAIVVGLLVVIVSVTLLRPEENTPLSGIETPGELVPGPPGAGDPGDRGDGDREPDRDRRDREGDRRGGEGGGEPAAPGLTGSESAVGVPPAGGEGGGDPGSPADDQYADTLTRLTERLN